MKEVWALITLPRQILCLSQYQLTRSKEEGLSLPQLVKKVLKKVPKKVTLLKSTEESTQKCTQQSAQVKTTQKSTLYIAQKS